MLSNATRNLVVNGLAELLAVEDADRYFAMPILEPTQETFPDAWSPDQDGVHRLLRRIMFYAGLGEMPVAIERFVFGDDDDGAGAGQRHVIAFFRGIENGVCRFGINCAALEVPERVIGILAHEVAHAYRALNELVVEDEDEEEELTDLTTIFLGFGLFTTNNAQQVTTFHNVKETRRAGYLSAHAMTYALAAWVRARGENADRLAIDRWLEPAQYEHFTYLFPRLRADRIRDALGAEKIAALRMPKGKMLDDAPAPAADAEPIDFAAARSDTFRVPNRPQWVTTLGGAVALFLYAARVRLDASTAFIVCATLLGAGIGYLLGNFLANDSCARRECEKRIRPRAARCPRCGASVQGVIKSRDHYLDALEDLRKSRIRERRRRASAASNA